MNPLSFLTALNPAALLSSLGVKTLVWVLAIIAVLGTLVGGYLFFTHTQTALVNAAAASATSQVTDAVNRKSIEVFHDQAVEMGRQIDITAQKNADADAHWNVLSDQTNQIKETNDAPDIQTTGKFTQPLPLQGGNRSIDDLNRASDLADGLLECASSGASDCR